jgi:hypothetical protein
LQRAGSEGTDWRLHAYYDLASGQLVSIEVTDGKTAEGFERIEEIKGDLIVSDRGQGRATQIHLAANAGALCLVRVYLPNIRLNQTSGEPVDQNQVLAAADQGPCDMEVTVPLPNQGNTAAISARLITVALPEEMANRARQKLRDQYKPKSKKGKPRNPNPAKTTTAAPSKAQHNRSKEPQEQKKSPTPENPHSRRNGPTAEALKLAGYLTVVSTVPVAIADCKILVACYRCRWAVENFFKRSKSLLDLDKLSCSNDTLSKVQILCKLLLVALVQSHLIHFEITSEEEIPPSIWKQTVIIYYSLLLRIIPHEILEIWDHWNEELIKSLQERPRKRKKLLQQHQALLAQLNTNITAAKREKEHHVDNQLQSHDAA